MPQVMLLTKGLMQVKHAWRKGLLAQLREGEKDRVKERENDALDGSPRQAVQV